MFPASNSINETIPPPPIYPKVTANMTGEQLAYAYCQVCHSFPEPQLLPKDVWTKNVLPKMALRMGVATSEFPPYQRMAPDELVHVVQAHIFPSDSQISSQDWKKIVSYYQEKAPASLPPKQQKAQEISIEGLWAIDSLTFKNNTLINLIAGSEEDEHIYFGTRESKLIRHNQQFVETASYSFDSPPVDIYEDSDKGLYVLTTGVGSFDPSDKRKGSVFYLHKDTNTPDTLLKELPRPVDMEIGDLNKDGRDDILICGFGHYTGWLAWYENTSESTYIPHILRPFPGAIKAYIQDMNQDGLPDIVVLMAQGNEGIFIYYNQGSGEFREEQVLKFPPIWGSSFFELIDMDKDGDQDIVYTCGDNGDNTPILKPYHGCRIFINDGQNHFSETFFFPVYGAFKALVNDYDKDGDMDIGIISFFPDKDEHPQEGFVYLENTTNSQTSTQSWVFEAQSFQFGQLGKWLVGDALDVDNDGDTDLILSNIPYSANQRQKYYTYSTSEEAKIFILENVMVSHENSN